MTGYKTDRHRTENGANSVAGRSHTSSFPIGRDSLQNEISRSGYKQYSIVASELLPIEIQVIEISKIIRKLDVNVGVLRTQTGRAVQGAFIRNNIPINSSGFIKKYLEEKK